MKWLLARLSEPSTWVGFAALIPQLAPIVMGGSISAVGAATIVGGVAGVLIPEKKPA